MSSEYTSAKGRKFSFTLAIAFAILAGLSYWRGREIPPLLLGALAALLIAGGTLVPRRMETLEGAWMTFAHAMSRVTTPLFMGLVYFAILTPVGALRRTFGRSPLVHPLVDDSYWIRREMLDPGAVPRRMERQF